MTHGNPLDLPCTISGVPFGSLREFFITCLEQLWVLEESFSGKRPLGNSGWQWGVYEALQEGGFISDAEDLDERRKADQIIVEAIKGLR